MPYISKKVHAVLNFNLKLKGEHYIPLCNEGKSKRNLKTKLFEFKTERCSSEVYAVYVKGSVVYAYNGKHQEMTLVKLHQLYENNIVLKKDLATDELINSVDQLEQCYDHYIAMDARIYNDTNGKIKLLKFKTFVYCIYDTLRFLMIFEIINK